MQASFYPAHRSVVLRTLEPLAAIENPGTIKQCSEQAFEQAAAPQPRASGGVSIRIRDASVIAGGHTILHNIHLHIEPGSHVAILGASGAGKSSLVNLLLGIQTPAAGAVLVDNVPLEGDVLARLRRETAWIAPNVQLWNRPLAENLRFGNHGDTAITLGEAVKQADLAKVLEKLPDGLQTRLGEGGALLSGGEGQRVRLGRGTLRSGVRLAILDEPFRGLEADARRDQLGAARRLWRDATLLFVTHDVADTKEFDRILIVEQGTIIEDGSPEELLSFASSRYSALLFREAELKRHLLRHPKWRRLRMHEGMLTEEKPAISDASVRGTLA